jgi:hypothetical protein
MSTGKLRGYIRELGPYTRGKSDRAGKEVKWNPEGSWGRVWRETRGNLPRGLDRKGIRLGGIRFRAKLGMVVTHIRNPSYSRGRGRRITT